MDALAIARQDIAEMIRDHNTVQRSLVRLIQDVEEQLRWERLPLLVGYASNNCMCANCFSCGRYA